MKTPSMPRSIIVWTDRIDDATPNLQRLRRFFGLSTAYVQHDDHWTDPIPPATLVLSRTEPPASIHIEARVLPFREAMRLAGFERVPSR